MREARQLVLKQNRRRAARLIDLAHLCVILACGIWTADLIVQNVARRPSSLIANVKHTGTRQASGVTFRLEDPQTRLPLKPKS